MIKHRNISALIAAAAFGSTALFGCSSKDDPESLTDDQLQLMETYTEKFTKATEQAKKDGNAKACQAVLDEYQKAEKKFQEKLKKSFEKLSDEEQEKKEEELNSKLGSKIQEKMSAMNAARSKCFETGGAADPVTAEQAAAEGKEMANGICDAIVELCGEGAKLLSQVAGQIPDICDSHVKPIVSKFEERMKEIQEGLQEFEIQDLSVADASKFKAANQALAQWEKSLTKFDACFSKPVGQMVVISSSKSPNGGGRLTIASYQLKPAQQRRPVSRHGAANLTPGGQPHADPRGRASPPRQPRMDPAKLEAELQAKLQAKAQKQTAKQAFTQATQQVTAFTEQIKALTAKSKSECRKELDSMMKQSDKMFQDSFVALPAAFEGDLEELSELAGREAVQSFMSAQQKLMQAKDDFIMKAADFQKKDIIEEIKQNWQAQVVSQLEESDALTQEFVKMYQTAKRAQQCAAIDQEYERVKEQRKEMAFEKVKELMDSRHQAGEHLMWPYFVRLSPDKQAEILVGEDHVGESETEQFRDGLLAFDQEQNKQIAQASKQCRKKPSAAEDASDESESDGDILDGEVVEELSQDQLAALETFLKDAAKVTEATGLMPKVMAEDEKLLAALQAPSLTAQQFAQQANQHSKGVEAHVSPTSLKDQAADPALKALDVLQALGEELDLPETLEPLLNDAKNEHFFKVLEAYSTKRQELMQAVAAKAKELDSKKWPTYFGGLDKAAVDEWLFKSGPVATPPAGGKKPKKHMSRAGDLAGNMDGMPPKSNARNVGDRTPTL